MLCVWSESVIFQRCFIVCFVLLHSFCQCIWGSITQLLGRGLSIWIKYFYQRNKTDTVACSFEMFVKPFFASRFHLCNEQQLILRRIFLGKTLYRCERWLKKFSATFLHAMIPKQRHNNWASKQRLIFVSVTDLEKRSRRKLFRLRKKYIHLSKTNSQIFVFISRSLSTCRRDEAKKKRV